METKLKSCRCHFLHKMFSSRPKAQRKHSFEANKDVICCRLFIDSHFRRWREDAVECKLSVTILPWRMWEHHSELTSNSPTLLYPRPFQLYRSSCFHPGILAREISAAMNTRVMYLPHGTTTAIRLLEIKHAAILNQSWSDERSCAGSN